MSAKTTTVRRAFRYARVSNKSQVDGFGLDRQMEDTRAMCRRHGWVLDDQVFTDDGLSAFTGSNVRAGELGVFIDLVKSGRIPVGSILIVENTDRLSRLPASDANAVITSIVNAGIDIATTKPEAIYTRSNINQLATWLPLQVQQCLAHEESLKKSERLLDAWKRKRDALAEGKKLRKKGPWWLRVSADGKTWVQKPKEVAVVRQIFRWAADGYGASQICGLLAGLCPEGMTGKGWQPNNVRKLLRSRQVLGELQPHVRHRRTTEDGKTWNGRKAIGEPVKDYYQAIIDPDLFLKVQQALDGRLKSFGRPTGGPVKGCPNLLTSLAFDCTDGQPLNVTGNPSSPRLLVSAGALKKKPGSRFVTVPVQVLEDVVLSQLSELKTSDVTGKAADTGDVAKWSAELTKVNHNLTKLKIKAATAEDPSAYFEMIDELSARRKDAQRNLEAAQQANACPAGDALGDVKSLYELLKNATNGERDELRVKTKAALRRLVNRIDVYLVPDGAGKLGFVAVSFRDRVRLCVFAYQPPHARDGKTRQPGTWTAGSFVGRRLRPGSPVNLVGAVDVFGEPGTPEFRTAVLDHLSGSGITTGTLA
jgi:DNA invertase Pin-like site-specific DNA recombinase